MKTKQVKIHAEPGLADAADEAVARLTEAAGALSDAYALLTGLLRQYSKNH